MQASFSIGELARKTGVKVPTIRYYESAGLLPKPCRTASNRRTYGAEDAERVGFIRHARELGFAMEDIRALLELAVEHQQSCHLADSIARRTLKSIEARMALLNALHGELSRMVSECGQGMVADCKVMSVIADHARCNDGNHGDARDLV